MFESTLHNPLNNPDSPWMTTFDPYATPENPLFSFYPPSACSGGINSNCSCVPSLE